MYDDPYPELNPFGKQPEPTYHIRVQITPFTIGFMGTLWGPDVALIEGDTTLITFPNLPEVSIGPKHESNCVRKGLFIQSQWWVRESFLLGSVHVASGAECAAYLGNDLLKRPLAPEPGKRCVRPVPKGAGTGLVDADGCLLVVIHQAWKDSETKLGIKAHLEDLMSPDDPLRLATLVIAAHFCLSGQHGWVA